MSSPDQLHVGSLSPGSDPDGLEREGAERELAGFRRAYARFVVVGFGLIGVCLLCFPIGDAAIRHMGWADGPLHDDPLWLLHALRLGDFYGSVCSWLIALAVGVYIRSREGEGPVPASST